MTIKLTRLDLNYILTQIEMAEAGQFPINPLLPFGLRQVAGTNNNLAAGQSTFGSADVAFPTLTTPLFQKAQATTDYAQTSGLVIDSSPRTISLLIASQNANNPLTMTAAQKTTAAGADGILGTADDVFVNGSAAAFAAQQRALGFLGDGYQNYTLPGADGIYGTADDTGTTFAGPDGILGTADDITTFGNLATPMKASDSSKSLPGLPQSLFIPNVTPDNGLSAPYNSFFTFFGQFFDHGLDKITTNSVNGTIFIPLNPDDPLYNPASPGTNFMIETRAQDSAGPDGILGTADDVHQFINQDTPFVDQSQTYGSDPSHQAFLRAYMIGADGKLHSTGALLGHIGIDGLDSMATWAELKANAAFLGLKITDYDVGNVPVLNVDAYGNLILGPHGFAEFKVTFSDHTTGFVEGNHAGPGGTSTIGTSGSVLVAGKTLTYAAVLTGNAFINDMAQGASPFAASTGAQLPVDPAGQTVGINPLTGDNTSYDPTLLAQHYVAGDGRVNENIGLTAIQNLFHSEHDRLLATIEATAQASLNAGDIAFASNWVLPGVVLTVGHQIAANEWNGERLFQAAKFGTETEYQHIVFDEFARAVAPAIHVFSGVNVNINPAISSEFANVVYRFGHSMLDENLNLYVLGADGKPVMGANGQPQMTTEGLIQAFTNPVQFANTANATADIVLGTVNQVGNEIDEFVTGTLQDNLLGLPLDLASLNIARGRDTGVPPLNLARAELFAQSGEVQLKPYTSWEDFGSQLKHIESLVNFVAAYGTHASLTIAGETNAAKQAAAAALVSGATLGSLTFNLDAYNFMNSLGAYANNKLAPLAIHDANGVPATWSTGSVTGLDDVDMWIGGLAEKQSLFGGVLGSTFEYVFRTQMEALQDGDRLYYLARIEGTDYEDSLQDSSLAQLIRANTNIKHLPGNIFTTPEYTIEATDYFVHTTDAAGNVTFTLDAAGNRIATASATWLHNPVTGALLVNVLADGTVQFLGDNNITGNQIVLGGTEGNDRLVAGASDADTVWGDGGNDYLDGGGGADFLFGGLGNDTLNGGQGADTLHGDEGNDTIYGGDGIDTIFGGDGNDYIEGGRGDDIIDGGLGNDIIIGNEGADTLVGDQGDDWLESQGGQGDLMFGDSGAPGGQLPLYSGNDVMVGGVAGGDVMKGFSGDDIMLGHGSFTKFEGGAGFDWGSYELATQGVDEDMNRKEFVAANGAVDNIRDVWQSTEGASGSAFDDVILGDNATKLLVTKDELDNVNLITGLAGFFDPGLVSFDGGNILLGGAGNDLITGGGGNDIIDGDAWLHVSLAPPVGSAPGTSGYSAGGQIIRQIVFDPKGNIATPGSRVANPNAGNVDTAGYFDTMSNYATSLDASGKLRFGNGPDAEGFITIQHTGVAVIVGGNPAGLLGVDDGTDRIRHIERLQFSDVTVSIDSNGRILTSSDGAFKDPNDPNYDAVPVGSPILTEKDPNGLNVDPSVTVSVGDILTASVALITDADNVVAGGNAPNPTGTLAGVTYQWQYQDPILAQWVNIAGGTTSTLAVTEFLDGTLGLRLKASYVDGKGYTETVTSLATVGVTPAVVGNTPPALVTGTQFNGISSTTALVNQPFDYFSPFTSIFTDAQTAASALTYTATLANGSALSTANLGFRFIAATGAGEFFNLPGTTLNTPGPINVLVKATDPGGLSVTNTFVISVSSPNSPPIAVADSYTAFKNISMTVLAANGVLSNDTDPNGNPFTAALITGPIHGTLAFKADGTFIYQGGPTFIGLDTFTYQNTDFIGAKSNIATVTINILNFDVPPVTAAAAETNTTLEDTPTVRKLLLAGTDVDGPVFPLVYKIVANSAINGTVTLVDAAGAAVASNTTGAYIFTPTPNYGTNTVGSPIVDALFGGPGAFQYVLNDSLKDSLPKTVTVNVTPVDDGRASLTLTGALAAGGTLTATLGADPEGIGIPPVYKWLNNGVAINGQTTAAYILTEADVGHTFSVSATYTDGQNFTATVTSATTNAAGEVFVKPTTTIPSAPVDTTLTASNNLTNIFGVAAITGGFTYNWETSADGLTWTAATPSGVTFNPGATGAVGEYVRAKATYVDNAGVTQIAPSLAAHYINDTGVTTGDTLTGIATADIIFGGAGNDVITGGAGNDFINTGAGNDTVIATVGDGNDNYIGGAGIDTYDLSQTTAAATVTLFNDGILPPGTATSLDTGSDTLTGFENVIGTAGNDVLTGNTSDNVLTGGAGDDQLRGAAGNDTLIGGAGNDLLDGGTGNDTMTGGLGDDTYFVDSLSDVIVENAGEGTDTVNVNAPAVAYTLSANLENLNFTGKVLISGTGIEFTGTGNTGDNIITGGAGDDVLNGGGGGNDKLIGGAGNDALTGGAGNDTLDGGTGVDTMTGGAGNDTYVVDNAGDVVVEVALGGTDLVNTTLASYTLTANVENLTYTGTAPATGVEFTGTGNASDNVISGGAGNDVLNGGGSGNDNLKGFGGNDILTGGAGNDFLDGGAGTDTMAGGAGDDTYVVDSVGDIVTEAANAGTDTINTTLNTFTLAAVANVENLTFTGTGAFTGTGNTLANVIFGGNGGNTLDGGLNAVGQAGDKLQGGTGNDTYVVRNTGDVVIEASATGGTDTVNTTLLSYNLGANLENLTFIGTGNFTGTGNTLNNVITGGAGADRLTGGAGNDTFTFLGKAFGADTITDFVHGQDRIDITGLAVAAKDFSNTVTVPNGKFSISNVAGGGSLISFNAGGPTIALSGVKANTITTADFIGLK